MAVTIILVSDTMELLLRSNLGVTVPYGRSWRLSIVGTNVFMVRLFACAFLQLLFTFVTIVYAARIPNHLEDA